MRFKILYLIVLISCSAQQESDNLKINGLCLVAPPYEINPEYYDPIVNVGANWVAIIPYAFCSPENPSVTFDLSWQWHGETTKGIIQAIQLAQARNLKILLKPHIWVKGQGWAGELSFQTEAQTELWQKSYAQYVLHYAEIADSLNIEMLSIGTEIRRLATQHPEYWKKLIEDVREKYAGKLTYAANWDNYQNIEFWNELDYIGIDAYFPISKIQTPSTQELIEKSKDIKAKIESFSNAHIKKVLFTEFGFQSSDFCTAGHWTDESEERNINTDCQSNALRALYQTYWNEQWFVGGFAWKWYYKHNEAGGVYNKRFTPQNKPAEKILRLWYTKYNLE